MARLPISFPLEFRTPAEHVDTLPGPGLPLYRGRHQVAFSSGLVTGGDGTDYAGRVKTPQDIRQYAGVGREWAVSGGWAPGAGSDGDFLHRLLSEARSGRLGLEVYFFVAGWTRGV